MHDGVYTSKNYIHFVDERITAMCILVVMYVIVKSLLNAVGNVGMVQGNCPLVIIIFSNEAW